MRTIIVRWIKEDAFGYGKAMRVIESDHKGFPVGSRFDYGFFGIAIDNGYTIISLPIKVPQCPIDHLLLIKTAKRPICGVKED